MTMTPPAAGRPRHTSVGRAAAAGMPAEPLRVQRIGIALAMWQPNLDFFVEQLQSIDRQSWTAWTCVVTCDSPLDAIRADARFAPFLASSRFHWLENPGRLGHVRNFERAIHACSALPVDAIACSDQDDIWEPHKLAVLAAALEQAGRLALVHSDMTVLGDTYGADAPVGPTVWQRERRGITRAAPEHLLIRNVVSGCTMLFDADLARRYPAIPPHADHHDQWFALLASCLGGVHAVDESLVRYRQHAFNVVGLHAYQPLPTRLVELTRWLLTGDLAEWRRESAIQWRAHVGMGEALVRAGLLARHQPSGLRYALRSLRWRWHDAALSMMASRLAVGSVMARLTPPDDRAGSPRPVPMPDSGGTPIRPSGGHIDVSVVVPAFLGRGTIADCLASVRAATRGRRAEMIVVESSGDGAADLIRDRFPEAVVITPPGPLSAGAARQRGIAAARGRLIFCVDQDCTVPPDWIDRLERHFADPAVGAAGGSVGIRDRRNLSGSAVYFLEFFRHLPGAARPTRNRNFLVGCNSALRAAAMAAVEVPGGTLGEDVLLSDRIRRAGWDVVYDATVTVAHRNRAGWAEFIRYNRLMGRAAADYHGELGYWWATPFLRWPVLAYAAPAVILPWIAWRLARSRWSYLAAFLLLSPACLVGNIVWTHAFRVRIHEQRAAAAPAHA